MYPVSEDYKERIKRPVQRFQIRGTVGGESFTENNILKGSFSLTHQCSGDDEIQIGSAYVGELNVTFTGLPVDRYAYQGAKVIPSVGLDLDGMFENIPKGIYTIEEAQWSEYGTAVKAYDNMSKLDRPAAGVQLVGTLWSMAKTCCDECGVELANLNFNNFPNGSRTLLIYPDNDIETYRDLVFWIAQTMCCFVVANEQGKIEFRPYLLTVVDELDEYHRFRGVKFSDYVTRYTGLSVVNIKKQTTSYYGLAQDDGLTYNLGSNPLLQNDAEDARRELLTALSKIQYVPFEIATVPDPSYQLGDVLSLPGGLGDSGKLFCITKTVLKYNGELSIKGAGKNPALSSARSKVDKELSGIARSKNDDTIQYYHFTNSDEIAISDGEEDTIIEIRFTATKDASAVFHAEVLLDAETTVAGITYNDAVGKVKYRLNETEVSYSPVETWQDGKHVLHLLYYLTIQAGTLNHLEVLLNMAGGSALIKEYGIKACVYGQNLVATDEFSGILRIKEESTPWRLNDIVFVGASDTMRIDVQNPIVIEKIETADTYTLPDITFDAAVDTVDINEIVARRVTEDGEYRVTEDEIARKMEAN